MGYGSIRPTRASFCSSCIPSSRVDVSNDENAIFGDEVPIPHDWRLVDTLETRSRLSVSDTSYFWDDFLDVNVRPGTYDVWICLIFDEGHEHVAAARLIESTQRAFERGASLGEVGIDFAQMGFCDREAVKRSFESIADPENSIYYDQLTNELRSGRALLPMGAKMVYVSTGYGDGTADRGQIANSENERDAFLVWRLSPLRSICVRCGLPLASERVLRGLDERANIRPAFTEDRGRRSQNQ